MSAGINALLEQISELNWAVQQALGLPDGFDMSQAWDNYIEMCSDPTWVSDPTSKPPNFHDWLLDTPGRREVP